MSSANEVPSLSLNDGAAIPQIGFGVFQVAPEDTAETVAKAFEYGYRSVDTAAMYGNEEGVGEAVAQTDIPRGELFITTKLGNRDHGRDRTLAALDASLERLGLDYVDLYLIHWPIPRQDLYVETWRALEEAHADGRARSIGVSNFHPEHLERLAAETDTVPAVNQIELHPALQQAELRAYHEQHGIVTEAWSPLAQGELIDDPVLGEIAQAVGRSAAQVMLRWNVQLGSVVIPKSSNPERMQANIDILGFELSAEQMEAIAALDSGDGRVGPHPDRFPG